MLKFEQDRMAWEEKLQRKHERGELVQLEERPQEEPGLREDHEQMQAWEAYKTSKEKDRQRKETKMQKWETYRMSREEKRQQYDEKRRKWEIQQMMNEDD